MIKPQFILPLARELIVDLFAGGGGASTGIEQATGRHVDIAINHDPEAVALHQANHPQTKHFVSDVFEVDPIAVCEDQPIGLLWASPDCKHFSKAKGGKPVSKKIRGLAWVIVKWAKLKRPRKIVVENVEEFQTWGPLLAGGRVCPERKGRTFRTWKRCFERMGAVVEHRELKACDYDTPTIRKRLFVIISFDDQPIVWPTPTNGPGLKPYRTAAECIDWSIPCPSIFERERPLVDATLRRIAHGLKRFVIDSAKPFIVPVTHQGDNRVHSIDEPLRTITTAKRGELALAQPVFQPAPRGFAANPGEDDDDESDSGCARRLAGKGDDDQPRSGRPTGSGRRARDDRSAEHDPGLLRALAHGDQGQGDAEPGLMAPTLIQTGYGERAGQAPRALDLHKPIGTMVGGQKHALVAAFLAKHYGDRGQRPGSGMSEPVSTITTSDHNAMVAAHVTKFRTGSIGSRLDEPLHTVTAGGEQARPGTGNAMGVVTSHLAKLRGTSASAATDEPLHTVSAGGTHHAEVRALLIKYYGTDQDPQLNAPLHTVTTRDRFGLVTIKGELYAIADIGMRMLQPRELYRAQGFPDSYVIDRGADGRALSKSAQVRMCGNSVCPPLARAIVAANFIEIDQRLAA